MKIIKKHIGILLLAVSFLIIFVIISGCIHSNGSNEQIINITSSDGHVTLTIPEGAMHKNTEISVQPLKDFRPSIENYSIEYIPVMSAYSLQSNGLNFKKPINVTMHYPEKLNELISQEQNFLVIHLFNDEGTEYETLKSVINREENTITAQTDHFSITILSINIGFFEKCESDRDCDPQYKYYCTPTPFEEQRLYRAEGTCKDIVLLDISDIIDVPIFSVCVWGWPLGGSFMEDCDAQDLCQCFGDWAVYKDVDCVGPIPLIRLFFSNKGPQAKCEAIIDSKTNCNDFDKFWCEGNLLMFEDHNCSIECPKSGRRGFDMPTKEVCPYEKKFIDCSDIDADAKCRENCNPRVECQCAGDVATCEKVECVVPGKDPSYDGSSQAACEVISHKTVDCNEDDRVYCDNNVLMFKNCYCDRESSTMCPCKKEIWDNCSASGSICMEYTRTHGKCWHPPKIPHIPGVT